MKYLPTIVFSSLLLLSLFSCKPVDDVYLYEVNELEVNQAGIDKDNLKSDLEFVSLAYADLFGTSIPENVLTQMVVAYNSLGDKVLIADIQIRNMLNRPEASVPSDQEMRANVDQFVIDTYKKFYVREPSEYELWYFRNLINEDSDITPEIVYYAFLTSDEYRYY